MPDTVVISLLLGLLQSHGPAILLGHFRCTGILVIERGGQVYQDTIMEHKGPGMRPLYGVVPLYYSVVAGLEGKQLATVVFWLLGLGCGFLRAQSLGTVRRMRAVCGRCNNWFSGVLGSTLHLVTC